MTYDFTGLFLFSQAIFVLACCTSTYLVLRPRDEGEKFTATVLAFLAAPTAIGLSFFMVYGPTAVALKLTSGIYAAAGAEYVFVNVFSGLTIVLSAWMVERAIHISSIPRKRDVMASRRSQL